MTAKRLYIGDTSCARPASHRLGIDAEHRGDLRRGEQCLGCVRVSHSGSFPPWELVTACRRRGAESMRHKACDITLIPDCAARQTAWHRIALRPSNVTVHEA